MVIDKNYPELQKDMSNNYTLDYISSNESVKIDLDKPLNINGPVYIDGNLISNVYISARYFEIKGDMTAKVINVLNGNHLNDAGLYVNGNIFATYIYSESDITANNDIVIKDNKLYSDIKINGPYKCESKHGNISVEDNISIPNGKIISSKKIGAYNVNAKQIICKNIDSSITNSEIIDYNKYKSKEINENFER